MNEIRIKNHKTRYQSENNKSTTKGIYTFYGKIIHYINTMTTNKSVSKIKIPMRVDINIPF